MSLAVNTNAGSLAALNSLSTGLQTSIGALTQAQFASVSTVPRTGGSAYDDNTFRSLTINYMAVVNPANGSTQTLSLNAYRTIVNISDISAAGLTVFFPQVAGSCIGDEITLLLSATGNATQVNLAGPNLITLNGGAALQSAASGLAQAISQLATGSGLAGANPPSLVETITIAGRANMSFIYDGMYWLEKTRMVPVSSQSSTQVLNLLRS